MASCEHDGAGERITSTMCHQCTERPKSRLESSVNRFHAPDKQPINPSPSSHTSPSSRKPDPHAFRPPPPRPENQPPRPIRPAHHFHHSISIPFFHPPTTPPHPPSAFPRSPTPTPPTICQTLMTEQSNAPQAASVTSASATVRAAARGVSSHLVWQVTARVLSFVIKAVVVRALGPAQFAFVEIRLVLLVALVLLPAIGAFRKVCLRIRDEDSAAALAYVCVGVTVMLALGLGGGMIYFDRGNAVSWSVVVVSLVLRAFAEPPLVFAIRRERYEEGSRARAVATVMSGLGQTVMVGLVSGERWGKPASASGHLFYSVALGVGMWIACGPQKLPRVSGGVANKVSREDLGMVGVRLGQAGLKFLLENAEGFVLDLMCCDVVKGAYKLAGNFASIVARFFSEAVEEQSFNVFHRLAPAFRGGVEGMRGKDMREMCVRTWTMALKAGIMVSVLIAVVGPAYSYAVLRLLYGSRWADETPAVGLLNLYFVYLVFMAGNGVSEAFVSAAASTAELKMQAKFTTILSVAYMGLLMFGARLYEANGIIAVNCLNMFVRTCYSLWFYGKLTRQSVGSVIGALPHPGVLLALVCARVVAFRSEELFIKGAEGLQDKVLLGRIVMHGMSGLMAVGMFGVSVLMFERGFIRDLKALRSHQD